MMTKMGARMKINLQTGKLYTDAGKLLKKMVCPLDESWQGMPQEGPDDVRRCAQCHRTVTDISYKTEEEVSKILFEDPGACLHFDIEESNIKVISHEL